MLLLPDDVIVVRFMDEYAEDFTDLVRGVADQVPLCP